MQAGWHKTIWSVALALLAFALSATPGVAHAQAGMVGRPLQSCIAPVRPGQTIADAALGRIAFDCSGDQPRYGPGDFWAVTPLPAGAGGQRIRIASVWHNHTTLAAIGADGRADIIVADAVALSHRLQLGAIIEFALPDRPLTRLIWRVDGAANRRGVLLGARLATPEESARSNLSMTAIYGMFGGLCVALIVYNLALWGALRHRFQLAYCLMVAMMLGYAFSASGAFAWLFPDVSNLDRLRVNYITLGAAAAAALVFARTFFEPRVFSDGLGRVVDILAGTLAAGGVVFAIMSHWWMRGFDLIYSVLFLALLLAVPAILWRAHQTRSRYLLLFGIAWAAPVAMAGFRVAHNLQLLPWSFWLDQSTVIAMTAEALLSSLAIAYRIRLLSAERDSAVAQESVSRKLAEIEPLTGLLNRRAFLEHAIGRPERQQLILADIDHFKRVNDTLGHDGGDEVLRVFARALRQSLPARALIARIGGEEFAILLEADDKVDPDALLAALRAARMPFDLRVTASLGICIGPLTHEADWKRLYRGADRALFEAKSLGRDRACHGERLASVA